MNSQNARQSGNLLLNLRMASSCRLGYLHFIFKVVHFVQFTALKQPIYSFKAADLAKLVLPSGWSIFEFKQHSLSCVVLVQSVVTARLQWRIKKIFLFLFVTLVIGASELIA